MSKGERQIAARAFAKQYLETPGLTEMMVPPTDVLYVLSGEKLEEFRGISELEKSKKIAKLQEFLV
jgi:hypothetical protein